MAIQHLESGTFNSYTLDTTNYELTNTWRHICIVLENDASGIPLYVDGDLVTTFSKAVDTDDFDDATEMVIGGEFDSTSDSTVGDLIRAYIGEFRIYF